MIATTKIYNKYQTVVPAEIRKKLGISKNHLIEWSINEKNEVKLNFRRKRDITELEGITSLGKGTNAVKIKKELYE